MKKFFLLAIFLVACTNNNALKKESIKVVPNHTIKKSKKVVLKKKVTISHAKPIEVARVCVDKQGKMHNCNYKIPKPYKDSFEKYNSIK